MITYEVKVYLDGTKKWYLNGQLHREDGPAVELANGDKEWYKNGKWHREDGPALERADGTKHWCKNDKLHREDGPACEYANGAKFWYLNGVKLNEAEFNERTSPKLIKELTVAEIEKLLGYSIKVVK